MLESMSCGRPLILGVDGQARTIMEAANAGIYVEPENAVQLAEAIVHLAKDPALGESLGANGRRHILQHFSREQTAKNYMEILQTLAGREETSLDGDLKK